MSKVDNQSKYVWRDNVLGNDVRLLCGEDGYEICAVYTLFGSWYVKLNFLDGSRILLEGEINSMAEAERAAVHYIHDLCAKKVDWYTGVLERLPI